MVLNPAIFDEPETVDILEEVTHDHEDHKRKLDMIFAKLDEKKAEFEKLK